MSAFDPVSVDSLKKQNFLLKIREEAWKARAVRNQKSGEYGISGIVTGFSALAGLLLNSLGDSPTERTFGMVFCLSSMAAEFFFLIKMTASDKKFKKTIKALGQEVRQAKLKARRQAEGWQGIGDPWRRQPKVRFVSARAFAK